MYLSLTAIREALEQLEDMHMFYGVTFPVAKQNNLPIRGAKEFGMNSAERNFMDVYYKPYRDSSWYFRAFRSSDKSKRWLDRKYPSSGSQKTRTQGDFAKAFIHPKNTDLWGWQPNYVDILQEHLPKGRPITIFHLAVWLYRERDWPDQTLPEDILRLFLDEFSITDEEIAKLFDLSLPSDFEEHDLFQTYPVTISQLRTIIGTPPGTEESDGTLGYLELNGIGPTPNLRFEPASRINLITGDNGLGKTFLLECAWWALTGQWVGLPAYPMETFEKPEITFQIAGENTKPQKMTVKYDWSDAEWPPRPENQTIPGLLIYARADSSYAIWDPTHRSLREKWRQGSLVFNRDQVWDGLNIQEGTRTRAICNGLIRDWVSWQRDPEGSPYHTFTRVLARLSPDELGPLQPGKPKRVLPDSREFPTLSLPYGDIPVIHASAGMRRIMALAYLVVWAWSEHKIQSELIRRQPQRQMVILIDEIEAHLHPRWQRLILPSILRIQEDLDSALQIQVIVATHSPLVMASVEPVFDEQLDQLFHLNLVREGLFDQKVQLEPIPFVKFGQVDSWLTEIFELKEARSREAETAIRQAEAIQLEDAPDPEEVQRIHYRLVEHLPGTDEFWPRWTFFAEEHGVKL